MGAHTLGHVELLASSCRRSATRVEVTHKDETVGRLHWWEGEEGERGREVGRRRGGER